MKETKDIFWQKVTGTKALAATEWQQNTNKECKPYVISETSLCFHIQEWSLPKKRDFSICHKRNWTLSKWCFSWCIANSHCLSPFTAFCFVLNWESSLQLKMGTAIPSALTQIIRVRKGIPLLLCPGVIWESGRWNWHESGCPPGHIKATPALQNTSYNTDWLIETFLGE